MQWRLEVIENALTVFGIAINSKFHEMNDYVRFNLFLNMSNWPLSRGLLKNIHVLPPMYFIMHLY